MTDDVGARLAKADKLLAAAEILVELQLPDTGDLPELAIPVAYYAAFHAAMAGLQAVHGAASSRHDRVIRAFGHLLTETFGERGDVLGQAFANAYALRVRVDYHVDPGTSADMAKQVVADAATLIEAAKEVVRLRGRTRSGTGDTTSGRG